MSILKGPLGYTRFMIKSEFAKEPESIIEKLNLFRFRPLHAHGEDNETLGWCPYLSEYDHDRSIEMRDSYFEDKMILTLRFDTIVLPKQLLKSLVKASISAYQREHKRFPDKTVRKEIELAEAKGLRARVLPKTKVLESIWCLKSQELRVFSRSTSLLDRYLDLFKDTFLIRPERRDFSYEAFFISQQKNACTSLENLSHQPIFTSPIRVDVQ